MAPDPSTEIDPTRDFWERMNARAVINMVPGKVSDAMMEAQRREPGFFELDEKALKRRVIPSPTDNRLRLAFWIEYDRAQSDNRMMTMANVYGGVCTRHFFEEVWIREARRIAWMLCMPISYEVALEESVAYGLDQMREILEMSHETPKGVNVKLLELKAKVFAMLDMRRHGAYTQTQKNLNLNVHTSDKAVAKQLADGSMDEVEARLKYLAKKERQAQNLPDLPGAPEPGTEVEVVSEVEGS